MRNRRLPIIAGLGIVELWILGLMLRSVCGGGHGSDFALSAAHFAPASAAEAPPGVRTTKTFETGPVPHVVIDDDAAALTVSVRPGMSVEVTGQSLVGGAGRSAVIEKTADGVRIAQADGALDVVLPPGAHLEVKNAGSIAVSGLRSDVALHTDEGRIVVTSVRGALHVKTDSGRIELADVEAPSIEVGSDSGRVSFDRVVADRVTVATDGGRVDVTRSLLRGGKIQSDSAGVRLALDSRSDVTVTATAASGKIAAQPPLTVIRDANDADAPSTISVGNGAGRLEVGSDAGSITVTAGSI